MNFQPKEDGLLSPKRKGILGLGPCHVNVVLLFPKPIEKGVNITPFILFLQTT